MDSAHPEEDKTASSDKKTYHDEGNAEVTTKRPDSKQTATLDYRDSSVPGVVLKPLQQLDINASGDSADSKRLENHPEKFLERGGNSEGEHMLRINTPENENFSSAFGDGETLDAELLEDDDSESDEDDSEDDDDGGWITPSNIQSMREKSGDVNTEKASVSVGCLTTDFAMQNVMIQMGLHVLSVNGMLIKRAKSYALRCFACMKVTSNLTKLFCPHCGNNTLQKVAMTVEEDGSVRYFLSKRKQTSTRGLKYSLPVPKGGKHADNPVLFEDQPLPQQRQPKKAQHGLDVFDPDYVANQSPFALNDTTSRAAQLGIRHGNNGKWNKRNPNASKKKTGRRK